MKFAAPTKIIYTTQEKDKGTIINLTSLETGNKREENKFEVLKDPISFISADPMNNYILVGF